MEKLIKECIDKGFIEGLSIYQDIGYYCFEINALGNRADSVYSSETISDMLDELKNSLKEYLKNG